MNASNTRITIKLSVCHILSVFAVMRPLMRRHCRRLAANYNHALLQTNICRYVMRCHHFSIRLIATQSSLTACDPDSPASKLIAVMLQCSINGGCLTWCRYYYRCCCCNALMELSSILIRNGNTCGRLKMRAGDESDICAGAALCEGCKGWGKKSVNWNWNPRK